VHLFEYKGRRFLLDIPTSLFLEVSPAAFDFLRKFGPENKPATSLDGPPDQEAAAVAEEISKLRELGLFRHEEQESSEEIDRYINRLLNKTSTNITLNISQTCNLACKYCYADSGTFGEAPKVMSWEVAKKAVDFLFARTKGCKEIGIIFFGGEPLLNFKMIKDVVEYSRDLAAKEGKRIGFSLTTNGTVLTDEIIEFLCRHHFGLKVSLDGPKKLHDQMRPFKNGQGSYDITAANLKKLLARRGHLSVRPTLTRHNVSVNELAEFFYEFGFTRIGFGIASGTCFEKTPYDLLYADMEKLFKEDEETAEVMFDRLERKLPIRYNPFENLLSSIHIRRKTRIRCGFGRGVSTVSADGKIHACHRLVGMEGCATGDLDQGIDREKVYQLLRNYYQVKEHCWNTCWARHICGGPCPQYVVHPDGHFGYPEKSHCEFIRKSFEFGIWFYDALQTRFPEYFQKTIESA
jgi:uncharacterized protein